MAEVDMSEMPDEGVNPFDSTIICPMSGEVIEPDDVDALWQMYDRCKKMADVLESAIQVARGCFGKLTAGGDGGTRRARGEKFVIKVEYPSTEFNNSKLKELWDATPPKMRDEILRVEKVGVNKTELKKALNTSGNPGYEAFVKAVKMAEFMPNRAPTIKLEKVVEDLSEKG